VREEDSDKLKSNKRFFQKNRRYFYEVLQCKLIFSGKLTYKLEYLKLSIIVLNKIRAPETFTNPL
jgi:hypothetical protein